MPLSDINNNSAANTEESSISHCFPNTFSSNHLSTDTHTLSQDDDLPISSTNIISHLTNPPPTDMCKVKNHNTQSTPCRERKRILQDKQQDVSPSSSLSQTIVSIILCIVCTAFSMEFSIRFPHFLSTAARMTFSHAWYQYDPSKTFFDTTILTYGTDYIIFILMVYASYRCAFATDSSTGSSSSGTSGMKYSIRSSTSHGNFISSKRLRLRSAALLACYAISVLAGGYAHQFYVTFEDLQTTSFRILWTICVGSVTLAGGFMGMCGSEICRIFLHESSFYPTPHTKSLSEEQNEVMDAEEEDEKKRIFVALWTIPRIPDSCWILYGVYMTLYCIAGGISCFRPAADIFLAGVTQFIPTCYCELIMLSHLWKNGDSLWPPTIPKSTRYIFYYGFILNAPLLPLYPYLIHHTTLTLGAVNALLHLNLTISWGMQAISLYQICTLLNRYDVHTSQDLKLRVTTKTL